MSKTKTKSRWARMRDKGINVITKVHPPPKDNERVGVRPQGMREIVYLDRVEIHIWQ